MDVTILGELEGDLCGDGVVLYLDCGGGGKMAQNYIYTLDQC